MSILEERETIHGYDYDSWVSKDMINFIKYYKFNTFLIERLCKQYGRSKNDHHIEFINYVISKINNRYEKFFIIKNDEKV